MDVNFDLSTVYPGTAEMVLLGGDLLPSGTRFPSRASASMASQRSAAILDSMGQLSALAQDLRQPITTADRVRVMHPEHRVYLMLDRAGNGGYGTVVGMLKVGRKNLFLLDRRGEQNEVYAQCILDFYVHERRQRSGCGRRLFEHMLKEQGVHPRFMAVDRPSPKLLAFLRKYYGLDSIIPQDKSGPPGVRRARIYMGKLQYI